MRAGAPAGRGDRSMGPDHRRHSAREDTRAPADRGDAGGLRAPRCDRRRPGPCHPRPAHLVRPVRPRPVRRHRHRRRRVCKHHALRRAGLERPPADLRPVRSRQPDPADRLPARRGSRSGVPVGCAVHGAGLRRRRDHVRPRGARHADAADHRRRSPRRRNPPRSDRSRCGASAAARSAAAAWLGG